MKALIAGGGIGGLTTALFLHKAGIEVEVFERAEDIRELGVGINMLPHAVKELAGIGLLGDLDARGIRTHELIYANRECRERCNRVFQSGRRLCPLPGVGKVDLNGRNGGAFPPKPSDQMKGGFPCEVGRKLPVRFPPNGGQNSNVS
jgi:hypothetical protein